ncbi:hypothetical protein [Nocardia sp. NPDC024068]|uniref:hypothetical protein n=1 Tax=Nocardia sp. NPDC024068 TaxID=3157197 RepID=UPI0033F414A4
MTHQPELTDAERETAYLLAEELIPEQPGELSADQAGLSAEFLDRVLALRPDLVPGFRDLLARAHDRPARAFCDHLMASEPAEFERLTFVLAGAYLMSPRVRDRLNYRGQIGEPQLGEAQPEYAGDGLLQLVRARGSIYRPTP